MYPKRVSRVRISLSPQNNDSQPAAIAAGCFRVRRTGSLLTGRRARKQTRGPSDPTAVSHRFARPPGGHRDSAGPRPAESRPFCPVEWKSLTHSKLCIFAHSKTIRQYLTTIFLSTTSIRRFALFNVPQMLFLWVHKCGPQWPERPCPAI